jgi:hypothetical protein
MAIEVARRFEQLSPKAYEHPADKAATSALHAVPLLDNVIKRLTDLGHERRLRQIVMGNAIRLGDKQVPDVWETYVRSGSVLDLPTLPDLYVTNDPTVNALTIGAKTPLVIVHSSLVGAYEAGETEWASTGLTDIHHQGQGPGKDVQNGDHGTEEAPSPSVVHPGVQGRHRRALPSW